jgi:hypothetical protein
VSLRSSTEKMDAYIMTALVLLTAGMWAISGFPFFLEVLGFCSLLIIGAVVLWLTSRRSNGK